jgi:hypothetical protein
VDADYPTVPSDEVPGNPPIDMYKDQDTYRMHGEQYPGQQGQITHPNRPLAPPITANQNGPVEEERGPGYGAPSMSSQTMGEDPLAEMHRAAGTTPMPQNEYDISGTTPMAPPLTPAQQYEADYQKKVAEHEAEMKAGGKPPGKGKQILFHIAQAMSNFAAGLQGQQMRPHENLGDVRDRNAREQAERKFKPIQEERKRRQEETKVQLEQATGAVELRNKVLEGQNKELEGKAKQYALNNPDQSVEQREDKTFVRRKGSNDPWVEQPELREITKKPIIRELPGTKGETFGTTGDKEADRYVKAQAEKIDQAREQGKITADEQRREKEDLASWQKESAADNTKRNALKAKANSADITGRAKMAESQRLNARADKLEEEDPRAAADLRAKADAAETAAETARGEAQGARDEAKGIVTRPKPTATRSKALPTGAETGTRAPTRVVSTATLEELSRKTGKPGDKGYKSPEELRKMAEKEKYTIQ